jgi:hypothetical protein
MATAARTRKAEASLTVVMMARKRIQTRGDYSYRRLKRSCGDCCRFEVMTQLLHLLLAAA